MFQSKIFQLGQVKRLQEIAAQSGGMVRVHMVTHTPLQNRHIKK